MMGCRGGLGKVRATACAAKGVVLHHRHSLKTAIPGERMDTGDRAVRFVRTVIETLKPGFAVRLWTGERIGPATGPTLILNQADIVWHVLRRPNLSTIVEMWMSKAVDVEGGSLFDIFERRAEGKLRAKLKTLPKLQSAARPARDPVRGQAEGGRHGPCRPQSVCQRLQRRSDTASLRHLERVLPALPR